MRILLLVNNLEAGGAQSLIRNQLTHTAGTEFHVVVLQSAGALSADIEELAKSVDYLGLVQSPKSAYRSLIRLNKLVQELKPDLIHSHLLQSDLINLLCKFDGPKISTLHTSRLSLRAGLASYLVAKTVALMSGKFAAVIACGEASLQYAKDLGYRTSVRVIRNGVEFPPVQNFPRRHGLKMLSVARWDPVKDHETLFSAYRLLLIRFPQLELLCAGEGMDKQNDELDVLLSRYQLSSRVQLFGTTRNPRALMRESSVLVISSTEEAMPMVGLEAVSECLPIVTTQVGDYLTLIPNPERSAPAGQPSILAECVTAVLTMDQTILAQQVQDLRLRLQTEYSSTAMANSYKNLYLECTQ